jgi:hypothetical protein
MAALYPNSPSRNTLPVQIPSHVNWVRCQVLMADPPHLGSGHRNRATLRREKRRKTYLATLEEADTSLGGQQVWAGTQGPSVPTLHNLGNEASPWSNSPSLRPATLTMGIPEQQLNVACDARNEDMVSALKHQLRSPERKPGAQTHAGRTPVLK